MYFISKPIDRVIINQIECMNFYSLHDITPLTNIAKDTISLIIKE